MLKPTGTPNDRALFINIEGFYLLDNHAKPVDDEPPATPAAADHDHAHDADDHHDHADGHDHDEADDHDHAHADEHEHEHEHAHGGAEDHDHMDADAPEDHDHEHDEDHEPAAAGNPAHEHAHEHGHGHDHDHGHPHHHDPLPENQREVTAILLLTASPPGIPPGLYGMDLVKKINKGQVAQAVLPIREIAGLFEVLVGPIELLLLALTVLIVVVAGIGILVSIYNSMSERRHEIAVMRALGAGRTTVMLIVLLESILLSLGGACWAGCWGT